MTSATSGDAEEKRTGAFSFGGRGRRGPRTTPEPGSQASGASDAGAPDAPGAGASDAGASDAGAGGGSDRLVALEAELAEAQHRAAEAARARDEAERRLAEIRDRTEAERAEARAAEEEAARLAAAAEELARSLPRTERPETPAEGSLLAQWLSQRGRSDKAPVEEPVIEATEGDPVPDESDAIVVGAQVDPSADIEDAGADVGTEDAGPDEVADGLDDLTGPAPEDGPAPADAPTDPTGPADDDTAAVGDTGTAALAVPPGKKRTYHSKRGTDVLGPLAILAALACAAVVAQMAFRQTLADDIPLAAGMTVAAAILLAFALRSGNSSRSVHLDDKGVLKLTLGDQVSRFDLTSPSIELQQVGSPGRRGWKVLVLRRGLSPVAVDARTVDPTTFLEALRQWRPDL
ncbi:hypothetical protein [Nocardioides sambongensis]|uniref:hypothetical protein n=1 Tax=Nocardioides sambongensis TaxID=2589074 RepID=UPI001128C3AC|nr:hypothetical protein [Nocardioides sambongensis]